MKRFTNRFISLGLHKVRSAGYYRLRLIETDDSQNGQPLENISLILSLLLHWGQTLLFYKSTPLYLSFSSIVTYSFFLYTYNEMHNSILSLHFKAFLMSKLLSFSISTPNFLGFQSFLCFCALPVQPLPITPLIISSFIKWKQLMSLNCRFAFYLSLKPSIGTRRKQSCLSNFLQV